MLTVILFLFSSIGVSIINGNTCACCFPWLGIQCQTPAIDLSCDDCTSSFCAMHVKGCQGSPPCQALCQDPSSTTTTTTITSSSSTTTPEETTSSMEPSTNTTVNGGFIIRFEFFIISFSLILLNFFN